MQRQSMSEKLLSQIWKGQQFRGEDLIASDGQRLRIVYPGRANNDSGPDFCGAVIATGKGELLKGDIELHVKASDWRGHGHHRDPRFNKVILHVVMRNDTNKPTDLQNGETRLILSLQDCLLESLERASPRAKRPTISPLVEPCNTTLKRRGILEIEKVLEEAGRQRFEIKAAHIEAALADPTPQQVLYEGIMEALGYNKNKEAFKELARRLPFEVIEEFVQSGPRQKQPLLAQSLLFGMAGLLPSQRPDRAVNADALKLVEEMEHTWCSFGPKACMREDEWRLFRVRPDNHPSRRLAGAGHLVTRFEGKGIVESLLETIIGAESVKSGERLEQSLVVIDSGYWARHADLVGEARAQSRSLIGRGRARDIVVNILLPFYFAWARVTSNTSLAKRAWEIYHHYPLLDDNDITKEMTNKLFEEHSSMPPRSAQGQQGLIHLFKTFCTERRCSECPLS